MFSKRQIRFAELIRKIISECLLKGNFFDSNFKTAEITVSFVKMSKDLRVANVYFMPLGGKDQDLILESLNKNKIVFQKYLSKSKIKSKFTPKLFFFLDNTFEEADKIEKLLLDDTVKRDISCEWYPRVD